MDKDKGSADLLSTKILYGIQSVAVLDSRELKNYQDQLCSVQSGPGQARGSTPSYDNFVSPQGWLCVVTDLVNGVFTFHLRLGPKVLRKWSKRPGQF